jgi:hypothetical protein
MDIYTLLQDYIPSENLNDMGDMIILYLLRKLYEINSNNPMDQNNLDKLNNIRDIFTIPKTPPLDDVDKKDIIKVLLYILQKYYPDDVIIEQVLPLFERGNIINKSSSIEYINMKNKYLKYKAKYFKLSGKNTV